VNGASTSPRPPFHPHDLLDASRFESHSIKIFLLSRDHLIEVFVRVQVERGLNTRMRRSEEVNKRTKEAVDFLVAALESGHSEVLTAFLGAMAKFHTYSFGNIMLIARQKPTLPTLPDFVHGTRLADSLNAEKRAFSFSPRWSEDEAGRM
jgi:hypothetical protein